MNLFSQSSTPLALRGALLSSPTYQFQQQILLGDAEPSEIAYAQKYQIEKSSEMLRMTERWKSKEDDYERRPSAISRSLRRRRAGDIAKRPRVLIRSFEE
jgi:hypothetical protein